VTPWLHRQRVVKGLRTRALSSGAVRVRAVGDEVEDEQRLGQVV